MSAAKLRCLFGAILLASSCLCLRADPPAAITDLETKIRKACEQHDLSAIKACYDFTGTDTYVVDQSLGTWQEYWNQIEATNWTFDSVEFASLDQLQADKKVSWPNIQAMIQPQKMGEHVYTPNLRVIGFITVHFKDAKGGKVGSMQPVGIESDGTAKFAAPHLAQ
jgi:hypothetical protein